MKVTAWQQAIGFDTGEEAFASMEFLNSNIQEFIELKARVACRSEILTGFARVADIPMDEKLPDWAENAVSLAVPLKPMPLSDIHSGPTFEYYDEYANCSIFTDQLERDLADHLKGLGFDAATLSQVSTNPSDNLVEDCRPRRSVSHRRIAAHAGLGWIGKNGLVITKPYGPAVLLASVLTNAPLDVAREVFLSRCGRCTECIAACPVGAINKEDWEPGYELPGLIDNEQCAEFAHEISSRRLGMAANVCGICLYACPYTRAYIRRNGVDI